jgi:hypothetical protein
MPESPAAGAAETTERKAVKAVKRYAVENMVNEYK